MKKFYLFCVVSAVFIVIACLYQNARVNEWARECEARGGHLVQMRYSWECLDKSVFK